MEESESKSEEMLLRSLEKAGVAIPNGIASIRDFTPEALVSVSARCLSLLVDETASSLPTSVPDSMVDKFKICTDLALATKRLGYIGDMNYYKFLYPSEEDLFKVITFLVERLSESSKRSADPKEISDRKELEEDYSTNNLKGSMEKANNDGLDVNDHEDTLKNPSFHAMVPELPDAKDEVGLFRGLNKPDFREDVQTFAVSGNFLAEEGKLVRAAHGNEDNTGDIDKKYVQKVASPSDESSKEDVFTEASTMKTSQIQHLEEELRLLKAAAEMAFDDEHPVDFHIEQLKEQTDARKHKIEHLESQWKPLEEKRRSIEDSLYANIPVAQERLQKLREIELEKKSVLCEIKRREDEYSKLSTDLEKQQKLPPRASYVERIKEITKNSRKQDADIERIMKDTRELQLESNSIQERLHRTYAVLDEMVFREAKKDAGERQVYRLLTSIHESFEQIREKILATNRGRREVAEHERKLAAMGSRSLNLDKLQAAFDAILKENEHLEQQLGKT
uniref:Coiled-coil domain-containing protein 22 homolog n=2 Tax=Rhizophora mucronata TaxID=61149 RepID=A0A2P2JLC9_RHIMU